VAPLLNSDRNDDERKRREAIEKTLEEEEKRKKKDRELQLSMRHELTRWASEHRLV
jgi:hypothetical protein